MFTQYACTSAPLISMLMSEGQGRLVSRPEDWLA